MADFAAEGGHWYRRDGSPCYEVPRAKGGGLRPTTLRDARKMQLVPSVTTIIKEAAAPGLERWKREQLLLAALTLPRGEGEEESHWLERVYNDSQEEGRKSADEGAKIHTAIECFVGDPMKGVATGRWNWAVRAHRVLADHCSPTTPWSPEKSFAHYHGYGGRVDLHNPEWVVDTKTKDGLDNVTLYDEHLMQLAAYRRGLRKPDARCGILFVDRNTPEATFLEASAQQLERGLWMFDALLLYWRRKSDYDASFDPKEKAA